MNYVLHLLIYYDMLLLVALGLNLASGYGGLLSLAHSAYFAVGGYVYAVAATAYGIEPLILLPAAAIGGAVGSFILSLLAMRLKGNIFVIGTLAVQAGTLAAAANWYDPAEPLGEAGNMTNGLYGIGGIPRPMVPLDDPRAFALFATLIGLLVSLLFLRLQSSPWISSVLAIRTDELAARSIGKRPSRVRAQVFAFSCAATALGGALYGSYLGYLDPSAGSIERAVDFLSMVIIGGLGSRRGPFVGAAVLLLVPEALAWLGLSGPAAAQIRVAIFGLLLVLLMHLRPQGLFGRFQPE